jgi:transketolase
MGAIILRSQEMDIPSLEKVALSARVLAMDAIQEANSGHPGLPLGCAELGAFLYGYALKHDPADPAWIDRDRFVLSAGHGSMFLYAHLHLAGYAISLDEIKRFRRVGSICAGHPEYGMAPGVETTTGPLGQGLATAVGMAIAESMLAARFNTAKHKIIDHYTYVLAGDGCMQEGVASEASSLAGHLKLGKLIVFYDSNKITIDGSTDLAFTEDVGKRYEAYGWQVLHGDMYDWKGLERLVAEAKADSSRPSLIILKSLIGKGAPTKQGTADSHGAPLGDEEVAKAKAALGAPAEKFWVAPEAYAFYASRRVEYTKRHEAWKAEFAAWKAEEPALAAEFEDFMAGKARAPIDLPSFKSGDKVATRSASGKCIGAMAKAYPNLVGGSADLMGPNSTSFPSGGDFSADNRTGRYLRFGIREFGMAAIANGISVHGGFRPFVATFMVFSDYLRPALRLSAIMKQPVIYVLTHDSIFIGEDGPTHQPIEHLAALRAIPNLRVLRPADAEETAVAWRIAMDRTEGPTVIALTRQNVPVIEKADPDWPNSMALGAYVVRNTAGEPKTVIVATGSEVSLALAAADKLGPSAGVRVVSMPCREVFLAQPKPIRDAILPPGARIVVAEAAVAQGWERIAKPEDIFSLEKFGESGPGPEVGQAMGFTAEALARLVSN